MTKKKIIARIAAGFLLVSAIPYSVKKDKETGALEIRSLLWVYIKTPKKEGENRDHCSFAMPPSGLKRVSHYQS